MNVIINCTCTYLKETIDKKPRTRTFILDYCYNFGEFQKNSKLYFPKYKLGSLLFFKIRVYIVGK